jgi:hypothetical protein
MAARTFTDSGGLTWEVFEVHRASQKAGAVSPGLENGWLAFVCGEKKRRLAPFPADWETTPEKRLEELCGTARQAAPARYPPARTLRPRLKRDARPATDASGTAAPADAESRRPASNVETTVRDFAHEARTRGLPAVAAMLELKTLLQREYPAPDSDAHNRQSVRRWFVDAYYFERKA